MTLKSDISAVTKHQGRIVVESATLGQIAQSGRGGKFEKNMKPIEPVYRAFGARLEQWRSVLGWTQLDLANKMSMSRGSIANIEVGRQRILLGDVEKFAAAFGSTPKQLMKGIWI